MGSVSEDSYIIINGTDRFNAVKILLYSEPLLKGRAIFTGLTFWRGVAWEEAQRLIGGLNDYGLSWWLLNRAWVAIQRGNEDVVGDDGGRPRLSSR